MNETAWSRAMPVKWPGYAKAYLVTYGTVGAIVGRKPWHAVWEFFVLDEPEEVQKASHKELALAAAGIAVGLQVAVNINNGKGK